MVEVLIEKGYAYFAGGNVYFDTSKLDDYFVFSSAVEKEQLQVGVRDDVEEDVNKKNKNDFVLWFTQSKFEDQALKWDSHGSRISGLAYRVLMHQHEASRRVRGYPLWRCGQYFPTSHQ